ncbi:hypothetical protein Salmuc_01722 [Salipiger mucosus DSM 16094]|uniref:Uncharacterized protein n=2 Tax=Salipiger mucosus TaxID=263378 RepID=S9QWH9_9RHOB|nr:hypothetical protein Salmuc_01722 [Salipiger mucosus DSM 16094]
MYYRVKTGKDENTILTTKVGPREPVLHDFSDVQKLIGSEDLTFGRHYKDKRLNGETFVLEDQEGRFYDPASDCFVPTVDETCVMTRLEAEAVFGDRFSDLDVEVTPFSNIRIEVFQMTDDPDVEGELVPAASEEEVSKFNIIVRVDYMSGCPEQVGASDVIEAHEGLDADYFSMYATSVKQSYPGSVLALVTPELEPEEAPEVRP